ncbi:MAG: response regulator [Chloroflexota bacterium]
MPTLYLTPASISSFAQFVLVLMITGYLLYLALRSSKRGKKSPHIVLLASFFICITLLILLLFLEASSLPGDRLFPLFWESVAVAVGLVFLVYFAYSFPAFDPRQKWERRAVIALVILYALYEGGYALYRLDLLLTVGEVHWRPPWTDFAMVACFLWVPLVMVRQAVRASAAHVIASSEGAKQSPSKPVIASEAKQSPHQRIASSLSTLLAASFLTMTTWLRHLWKPQGRQARATRALVLVFLLPLALSVILLLNTLWVIPANAISAMFSLGILFSLFVFSVVYLNHLVETTTFMVRVTSVTLMSILAVLSVTGWWLGPLFIKQYPPDWPPSQQTLRFTPNANRGYDVTEVPFHLEPIGEPWQDVQMHELYARLSLPFAFPFHDKVWQEVYISIFGAVTFGRERVYQDFEYRYGGVPAILLLYPKVFVQPLNFGQPYIQTAEDRVTITWQQPLYYTSEQLAYTLQLTLYLGGNFDITYANLNVVDPRTFWTIGVLPGDPETLPHSVDLFDELPFNGGPEGIIHDNYPQYRQYLHRVMLPLAELILGSLVLIIIGLPWFLYTNVIRPLGNLMEGIRHVEAGDLSMRTPVVYHDEVGSLTQSFNTMTAQLQDMVTGLESQVEARTTELAQSESRYRGLVEHLDVAIFRLKLTKGIHEYLSPVAEKVFGHPLAVIQSTPHFTHWVAHPHSAKVVNEWWASLLKSQVPEALEYQTRDAAGGERWIFQSNTPIYDQAGQLVAIEGWYRDITAYRQAEEQVADQQLSMAILEERQRLSRELHDSLGQVLNFVQTQNQAAQDLIERGDLVTAISHLGRLGEAVQDANVDMREFIQDIRSDSLTEAGFFPSIEAYLRDFQRIYKLPVNLVISNKERSSQISTSAQVQFLRILQEVMTNVRRHASANSVQVIFTRTNRHLQVVVADDGVGFDAQQVMGKDSDRFGLEIMRQRAVEAGGSLEVRSVPGRGTQVIVHMPLIEAPAPLPPLRILLADDHALVVEGLRNLLSERGAQVVGTAQDGEEAVRLSAELNPDLVLLDVHMPVLSGPEAAQQIKAACPEIKVVMLSVSSAEEDLMSSLRSGADGYLLKSLDPEEFCAQLASLARGETALDLSLVEQLAQIARLSVQPPQWDNPDKLLPRQVSILRWLAEGKRYKEIALELNLSERTIRYEVKGIRDLLGLTSRAELVEYARRTGLVRI